MPINIAKEDANIGKVIYQWKIKEYEQYERGKTWYLVFGRLIICLFWWWRFLR